MAFKYVSFSLLLLIQLTNGIQVKVGDLGTVTGKISTISPTVAVYKAIPYAQAPINKLRWQPPVPHGPFGQVNGTQFGNRCMELDKSIDGTRVSEDCLFLNVAAPLPVQTKSKGKTKQRSSALLPVMVWIHGGAYVSGSSNLYQGDAMVATSNNTVIVVTLNYRLSIFGFLGGSEVGQRSVDSSHGNFGIQDQRLAMKWVYDHIQSFGGDPSSITTFGESAGGNSVFNHLAQTQSFPYYNKAIIESGVYDEGAFELSTANKQYNLVLDRLKCQAIDCLLSKSSNDLLLAVEELASNGGLGWGPVVDGISLTTTPEKIFLKGRENKNVSVIIGSNRDEMAFWTLKSIPYNCNQTCFENNIKTFSARTNRPINNTLLNEIMKLYSFNVSLTSKFCVFFAYFIRRLN
jgi:carboxylesterase type B